MSYVALGQPEQGCPGQYVLVPEPGKAATCVDSCPPDHALHTADDGVSYCVFQEPAPSKPSQEAKLSWVWPVALTAGAVLLVLSLRNPARATY